MSKSNIVDYRRGFELLLDLGFASATLRVNTKEIKIMSFEQMLAEIREILEYQDQGLLTQEEVTHKIFEACLSRLDTMKDEGQSKV